MTVLNIIGTRPEGVKMAPVIAELARHSSTIRSLVCVTGQHREMLEPILQLFGITTDYDLKALQPEQSLAQLTSTLIQKLDPVIAGAKPDWILVQGDTTTVLVAGLLSYYHRVRLGHIEAGLRTGNKFSPFPEEMNRRMTAVVADAHFAPTDQARNALLLEGCDPNTIYVTGNTIVDAMRDVAARPFDWKKSPLSLLPESHRIVLITAHRREHLGEPLREICKAIRELATSLDLPDVHFAFPVHLNPDVRGPVRQSLAGLKNVSLLEPLDYMSMIHLMKRASVVLTDSGGVQEEAPSFGVPVVVMRDSTERPEGIDLGLARLVGTDRSQIVAEARNALNAPTSFKSLNGMSPYGDGHAAERIVSVLLNKGVD